MVNDREAAKFLGNKVQTLRNWRCQRRGPAYIKLGRSVRYRIEDLQEYILRSRIVPEK
jgi:hypothetical protein